MRWKDSDRTTLIVTITPDDAMRKMAKDALDCQDASNLCGVAQTFARHVASLLRHPDNKLGTDWANQHPITKLFINKLEHLARMEQDMQSFATCSLLADGSPVEWDVRPIPSDLAYLRSRNYPAP